MCIQVVLSRGCDRLQLHQAVHWRNPQSTIASQETVSDFCLTLFLGGDVHYPKNVVSWLLPRKLLFCIRPFWIRLSTSWHVIKCHHVNLKGLEGQRLGTIGHHTCFVILSHSISTCLCNPVTRNSSWWFNIFFIRVYGLSGVKMLG